jgi:hypothetical protein
MQVTNTKWIDAQYLRPVGDQPEARRFIEPPSILRVSAPTQTHDTGSPLRLAIALVMAAFAIWSALLRGPTEEEVLADAVRDFTSSDVTVLHAAATPVLHPDERNRALGIDLNVSPGTDGLCAGNRVEKDGPAFSGSKSRQGSVKNPGNNPSQATFNSRLSTRHFDFLTLLDFGGNFLRVH